MVDDINYTCKTRGCIWINCWRRWNVAFDCGYNAILGVHDVESYEEILELVKNILRNG